MDLDKFKRRVARKRKTLRAFLRKLDEVVPVRFSRIVAEEDARVWQEVDCTTCANCCKTMTPTYASSDITRIATHLRMNRRDFVAKYLQKDEDSGAWVNQEQPCPFLVHDKCSIYAVRPKDCAAFPHHFKRPFDQYNETYIQNLGRCPATFQLIDRLEKRVRKEYDF